MENWRDGSPEPMTGEGVKWKEFGNRLQNPLRLKYTFLKL